MTMSHGTQHQTYVDEEKIRFEMHGFRGSLWKVIPVMREVKLGEQYSLLIES